jgi:teichuronic acid biosynthesis glycosyltransferase TuaG
MTDDALVSIITPCYNADRFLPEHLASVSAQSYASWEHLLVDDGSTDGTATILAQAAAADPRRRVISQANAGAHAARNAGLAAAAGRYIAFLDADDLWLPGKLEQQLAFMRSTGAGMSYHWYRAIDVEGRLLSQQPIWMPASVDYRGYLRLNGTIGNLTVVIDRQATGPFTIPDLGAEDFALFLTLLKRVHAQGLFADLARHRVVPGSLSSNKVQAARWIWQVYREQEGIGVLRSAGYLAGWGWRGLWKNVRHKAVLGGGPAA